jgi:hypothetical protein
MISLRQFFLARLHKPFGPCRLREMDVAQFDDRELTAEVVASLRNPLGAVPKPLMPVAE